MGPHLDELQRIAPMFVSCYPNAGLPDPLLPTGFPATPSDMAPDHGRLGEERLAQHRGRLLRDDAGAHPRHRGRGAGRAAARAPEVEPYTRLSGWDALTLRPDTNFVNVGERTNVTGSPRFSKLILAGDYEQAVAVARQQVTSGAQILDVNMDEGMLDSEAAMVRFLNLIAAEPDIAPVPVMVDSSKWSVIEAGLKCLQGKGVVNSISLKEGEDAFRNVRTPSAATGRPWS
jgi:5-methyltetrahydrofolate--homocysteine methyltransferase